MMSHTDLVRALVKPGADIVAQMTAETAHVLHMAVGISGEVSELVLADQFQDDQNRVEELGDIEFYFEGLRQCCSAQLIHPVQKSISTTGKALTYLVITSGQVLDLVKKIVVYNNPALDHILESHLLELRNALDAYYRASGIHKRDAITNNISKLSKRYSKLTYSDLDARLRADKE